PLSSRVAWQPSTHIWGTSPSRREQRFIGTAKPASSPIMRTPINSSSRNIIMGGNCQVDDYPSPTSNYASFSSGCPDGNTILNGRDCFQICVHGGEILLRHLGVHGPGHNAVKFAWRHGLFQVGGVGVLFKARYKIFPRP